MRKYFIGYVITLATFTNFLPVHSANIVFYFGISSYSHRIPAWPLAEALADKGHNVTFVSPFPSKSPNLKITDYTPTKLKEWVESWGDLEDVFQDRKNGRLSDGWTMLPGIVHANYKEFNVHMKVQNRILTSK